MRVRCCMPKPEHIIAVAREWIVKAENDLKNAANTLKMGEDCPTDTVCFHAQQCAEKYLKALLVWKGIPFPKTHDLPSLMAILPEDLHNLLTGDRKSTRLNSSHSQISYAVFCLKKQKEYGAR